MLADPYYKKCARHLDGYCSGKITLEHTIIFGSRQLNEKWAIIPLCEYHHACNFHLDGPGLDKDKNIMIALNRATDSELIAVSKVIDYRRMRINLNIKYNQVNEEILI